MYTRLTCTALCALGVSTTAAQVRPETQWALGLGVSVLGTSGYGTSGAGFGLAGSYSRMFSRTIGLEAEGRMATGSETLVIPGCVPGTSCEASTIIPGSVVGADLRLLYRPVHQLRLSAGPAIAYAPGARGPNSGVVGGVSGGLGVFPFRADGSGLGLEMRGTKFFSPLGEVEWAFGTGLSYRF